MAALKSGCKDLLVAVLILVFVEVGLMDIYTFSELSEKQKS